jgi:hypothetical protein
VPTSSFSVGEDLFSDSHWGSEEGYMVTRFGSGVDTGPEPAAAARTATNAALDELEGADPDFCQVFCSSTYEYGPVLETIRDAVGTDVPLVGGSSTGEFTEDRSVDAGVAIAMVASDSMSFATGLGEGLGESVPRAVREAVSDLPETVEDYSHQSAIVLHDGLAGVGERLTLVLQRRLGPEVSFAGGAISDNYEMEETVVFHDDEIVSDGIVVSLIGSEQRPIITTNHGHEPLSDPVEVTESDGTLVGELDGRPAYDVWKDAVREMARSEFGVEIDELENGATELMRLTGEFEFGIDQGEAYKMRWPRVEDTDAGTLRFAVEIPEGTVFRVMHGGREAQVQSAREAAREAVSLADGEPLAGAFVYDCACREIILGDEFGTAVDAMDEELGIPFSGFETYGEISMQLGQMSGFHNTTTVIMAFPA